MRLAFLVLLLACGDDAASPDAAVDAGTPTAAVAVFDLGALPALTSVPYPSDLYLEAGSIELGDVPFVRGGSDTAAFESIRRIVRTRSGFCTTCAVTFAIEGELDPTSVPASASPFDDASLADAIVLADIDPDSAERGRLVPLRIHYDQDRSRIAVRPVPGIVLARDRRYAVALTNRVRGATGPLLASADFAQLRDGDAAGDDANQRRAREILDPAFAELTSLGMPPGEVVALAVFTTGDASRDLVRIRELADASPPDMLRVDRVWRGDELDDLLGVPADPGPGIDAPPAEGTGGDRAIAHETVEVVVTGTFRAPRLVTGAGTEVGVPRRNDAGELEAGPLEDVPFLLVVPRGATLASLPVVISLHGFNASRITGFALADTAGREGAAVLAIDYFQHGERAASALDERHAMRGELEGPDGFAETSPIAVSARVFGIAGVASGTELSPEYALGSLFQFVADALATIRVVRDGDLSAIREGVPELAELSFDQIFVVGNSLGAEVASMVATVESGLAGVVLNVIPGSVVDNLVESPEFRPITETLFLPRLGLVGPFLEPRRGLELDLVIDLYRFALEAADPLAIAPHLFRDPVRVGDPPDVLVQLGGLDEVASRRSGEATVAAMGIPSSTELDLADVVVTSTPVQSNFPTTGGPVTALASWLEMGGHGMMELRQQESRFVPPALPPHERRAEPVTIINPIDRVHEEIAAMLRTRTATSRSRLE